MPQTSVLSIEDEPDMVDLIRQVLARRDINFIGAHSGQEGIEAAQSSKPTLILLDIMMPDIDGWQIYEMLKTNADTQHIPVVIVTAQAQSRERLQAVRLGGVDDYLVKPFTPADLLASIDRALTHARPEG